MSRWNIPGAGVPSNLLYAPIITSASILENFPPLFAYAVACRESIVGEMNGKWNAASVVSGDGGHGLFQLTSSWPDDWDDPHENTLYALRNFLLPAAIRWHQECNFTGDTLIKCVAATFNAGWGGAWHGHTQGDVDKYTTDQYGAGVLGIYHLLIQKGSP